MTRKAQRSTDGESVPSFTPVPVRFRHDGWTADKQLEFIDALSRSGCVAEACAAVGKSVSSAYALRKRPDAQSFRHAWNRALDLAVERLADAVLGRAIHGVATPVYYKGEQIGERRRYDDRLAQFVLQYRDPVRYGKWRQAMQAERHPDAAAIQLSRAVNRLSDVAYTEEAGLPRPTPAGSVLTREERDEAIRIATGEKLFDLELRKAEKARENDSEGDVA